VTQWASSATASSQYSTTGGAAAGAVGPPDDAECQRNRTATSWWPKTAAQSEWLEVTYATAVRAKGLRIREENVAPFVMRVDLVDEGGTAHTVYEGGDETTCGGWLEIPFPLTDFKVKGAKVYTRTTSSYAAIDAVGLDTPAVESYAYNGFNQLLEVAGNDGAVTAFGYDGNGNQVSKAETASGGSAQLTQYVYDEDDRLVGIALPTGVSNAFQYDANGLRTKKTDSSGTTSFLLDGLSVVGQYAPDGQRQAWYTQSPARIDEVLSVVNGQGKYWYQGDALGSTYALTTTGGLVAARGDYDVFGTPVPVSGNVGQPFGFTGREHDLDTALVYARARYLNPSTGRWDRADPIGQAAGPNYYAYVDADPVGRADPTGYMGLPNPVPPPLWPPAANQPMRPRGVVLDTVSAYAMAHTAAFMWLLYDLGEISEEVWKKIQKQCDDNNDSLEEFWRGDSYERASVSVTTGFLSAGIGIEAGQLGPGLYISRERPVAVRYADRRKAEFGRGAVIDILVRTSVWKAVLSLGAVDGLPIAGDVGTQAFVPTGMALGLFDAQSWKMIHEVR
jgi:RHS repeat-associated protein